jgi:hypothetical protein
MPDFDDLDDPQDLSFDRGAPAAPPPPPAPGPSLWPPIAIAVIVGALGGLWYFSARHGAPPSAPAANGVAQTTVDVPKPPDRLAAEPGEQIDLPPLDETDALMRTLVGRLSSHPAVAAWLTTTGLIRNFTVVVVNIAAGETPAKHLTPLKPTGAFTVQQTNGLTFVDPASYARYSGIAAAVDAVDARGVARLYATIKPRIDDASRDLGIGGDFDATLERAIVMLLRTPLPPDRVQVRPSKLIYEYADPSLEGLTKAQRQFLRMGPGNVKIVQAKLREVARHLGIPDERLK